MGKAFRKCQRSKGRRFRTIKPNAGTYIHICTAHGKSVRGEVHHNKTTSSGSRKHADYNPKRERPGHAHQPRQGYRRNMTF